MQDLALTYFLVASAIALYLITKSMSLHSPIRIALTVLLVASALTLYLVTQKEKLTTGMWYRVHCRNVEGELILPSCTDFDNRKQIPAMMSRSGREDTTQVEKTFLLLDG